MYKRLSDAEKQRRADERKAEQDRRIHEYASKIVAENPMTPEQRQQVIALLRPTARKLREQEQLRRMEEGANDIRDRGREQRSWPKAITDARHARNSEGGGDQ